MTTQIPYGMKAFKTTDSIITQICPGCGRKNCGFMFFGRKKSDDPCWGETCCKRADIWHAWDIIDNKGNIQHFWRPNINFWLPDVHRINHLKELLKENKEMSEISSDHDYYNFRIQEIEKELSEETSA
jgi:hypothetical protein